MKKGKKRIILAVLLLGVLALPFAGGNYLVSYALQPQAGQNDLQESLNYMRKEYPSLRQWMDSLAQYKTLHDTILVNHEGKALHAFYMPHSTPTTKTAVIVHGYTDNAIRMLHIAYLYSHSLGYNVLLPDLQYHGQSEGNSVQMGWKDRLDVLQWMKLANCIYGGNTQMVIHGISMGAATIMMVSGEPQASYVKCFVEDCGYTSVWDQYRKELKEDFGLPAFPLLYAASQVCQWRYGWNFREASALAQVKKCKLPMLFIHGDADTYVPTSMVHPLYEAKPTPKELWIVPKSGHALSYKEHPDLYTQKVRLFTNKYIH